MSDGMESGGSGYERLGGAKLSHVDVVAQSVGFMGPVFSAAFIIPLIVGIISATGKGAGVAAPLSVLLAGIGVFALGWIVAQYAKRIHAAGALYDYVSNGLGRIVGGAAGWLYYAGTIVLTTGLGVLIGGYIHDTLLAEFEMEPLPIWAWNVVWAVLLFAVLYFGVRISTRVQLTLALVSAVVVLAFFVYVITQVETNDAARAFNPDEAPDGI
ncbi:MAG: amino acid permease, partial [Actinomycetes bacterium]